MNCYKLSILAIGLLSMVRLQGMQLPRPSLSSFPFNGASVLPYTIDQSGTTQALLAREAGGGDEGTYDAFGGRKDPNETHPVETAAREYAEETIGLVGSPGAIRRHIDVAGQDTLAIIANYNKSFVIYVTYFDLGTFKYLSRNFAGARTRATGKYKEKDRLAWVEWNRLSDAISNAQRDSQDHLLPVRVKANVVNKNGIGYKEKFITLRPVFVSSMQSYFRNAAYVAGHNPKIRFYQR